MLTEFWKFNLVISMIALWYVISTANPIAILLFIGYYLAALVTFNEENIDGQQEHVHP